MKRAARESDIQWLVDARADDTLESLWQPSAPYPYTTEHIRRNWEAGVALSTGGTDDVEWFLYRSDDPTKTPVGIAGIYDPDLKNGVGELGVAVVRHDQRQHGFGLDALVMMAVIGYRHMRLNKLYGFVKGGNTAALGVCRRIGLTEEGILREHRFLDGEYADLHVFGLLSREWNPRLADWRSWTPEELAPLTDPVVSGIAS